MLDEDGEGGRQIWTGSTRRGLQQSVKQRGDGQRLSKDQKECAKCDPGQKASDQPERCSVANILTLTQSSRSLPQVSIRLIKFGEKKFLELL